MTPRKMLRARQVAEVLDVKLGRVYELAQSGGLPVVRVGRQVRFDPMALERWIQQGGQALPGGWKREAAE